MAARSSGEGAYGVISMSTFPPLGPCCSSGFSVDSLGNWISYFDNVLLPEVLVGNTDRILVRTN